MKCNRCPFYYNNYQDFNECKLLHWECSREADNCTIVNDNGTVNQNELDKIKEFLP